jgi:hypothetical protein
MTIALSNPFTLTEVSAPSWWLDDASFPEKTWTQVARGTGFGGAAYENGTSLDDVKYLPSPGGDQAGILSGWTGGCVDQRRGELLLPKNGGHSSYAGNEVYAVSIREEVPRVYRLTDPTPAGQLTSGDHSQDDRCDNADGLPRATHNYSVSQFDPVTDHIVIPYQSGTYNAGSGGTSTAMWTLNRGAVEGYMNANGGVPVPHSEMAANAGVAGSGYWEYRGLALNPGETFTITYAEAIPAWSDPATGEVVWSFGWPSLYTTSAQGWKCNPSVAGEWTTANGGLTKYTIGDYVGGPGNQTTGGSANFTAHTLSTPIGVTLGKQHSDFVVVTDLSDPTTQYRNALNPSGVTLPGGDGFFRYGGAWHAPSNAALISHVSALGANFYKVKIDDPASPLTSTWTISQINAVSGSPLDNGYQTHSRFNIIDDMGDGRAAIVHIGRFSEVNVFKLPAGEVT